MPVSLLFSKKKIQESSSASIQRTEAKFEAKFERNYFLYVTFRMQMCATLNHSSVQFVRKSVTMSFMNSHHHKVITPMLLFPFKTNNLFLPGQFATMLVNFTFASILRQIGFI